MCGSVLQFDLVCSAVFYSVLQCAAMHCSVLQRVVLQYAAVCCSVRIAMCCSAYDLRKMGYPDQ